MVVWNCHVSDLRLHYQTATCHQMKLKPTVVPLESAQGGSNVPKRSDFYVLHDEVEVCTKVPQSNRFLSQYVYMISELWD